jgi:hypothetical protein
MKAKYKIYGSVAEEEAYEDGYDDGQVDAYENLEIDNLDDLIVEEIGVNFCVEKFKDCKTLEEFQTEYQFIYSRSLNFIR